MEETDFESVKDIKLCQRGFTKSSGNTRSDPQTVALGRSESFIEEVIWELDPEGEIRVFQKGKSIPGQVNCMGKYTKK